MNRQNNNNNNNAQNGNNQNNKVGNNQNKNGQNQGKNNNNNNNPNQQGGGGGCNKNKFQNGHQNGGEAKHHNNNNNQQNQQQQQLPPSQPQAEKKFTGRCRLFVGNLPQDITEADFKELFTKYGEIGECFLNVQRSFGFIKLDTRFNAEHAKQDLDGITMKGRCIRVRFASHGAAIRVKNLSPFVSNEYLEQAFSMFGAVERAVVIVDDKGRPTGEGIVEFERKPAATQCLNRCIDNCFILTSYPKPVHVEPLEQKDDEDGLPEKSIMKNAQFYSEREVTPHFAPNNSLEHELAIKWRDLYEFEKQINEEGKKRIEQARELLEYEIEQRLIDHKTQKIKEDLRAKQEELQRIEDMRKNEFQRRKDMEMRRQDDMNMFRARVDGNPMGGGMNGPRGLAGVNPVGLGLPGQGQMPPFDQQPLLNQVFTLNQKFNHYH
jgi:RNA recognition motif-containing protein